jgi:hypothetical protein
VVPDHTFPGRANQNIFTVVQEVRLEQVRSRQGYAGGGSGSGHYFHVIAAPRPFVGPPRISGLGHQGAPFFPAKTEQGENRAASSPRETRARAKDKISRPASSDGSIAKSNLIEKVFAPAVVASAEHAHDLSAGME